MFIQTIKSPGLAQMSYLVGDEDAHQCVTIDPRRDADIYIKEASKRSCKIIATFDTHIHADFVSGSRELASCLNIPIHGGKSSDYGYPLDALEDGAEVQVGDLTIRAIHTPGHSPEHLSYLISGGEGAENPWGLFTGDTLFAGSVGRPDLAAGMEPDELAGQLHHSLFEKLLPLGNGITVYPGHGSGSPCGGSIGDRDQTTLGYEAEYNAKLQADGVDEFVEKVLEDLPAEPDYYSRLKALNAEGAPLRGGRLPLLSAQSVDELSSLTESGVFLLDVREVTAFAAAHIPGAINIALRSSFPPWAGRTVPCDKPVYLIADDFDSVTEAHSHLYRMGFDNIEGYLLGGMRSWIESGQPVGKIGTISPQELHRLWKEEKKDFQVLDVRSASEWEGAHLPGALHCFAADLDDLPEELDSGKETVVYCGSDFRADLAASLLARKGFDRVTTLLGSMKAWKAANLPVESERE